VERALLAGSDPSKLLGYTPPLSTSHVTHTDRHA
jgi:hypothetical protein